MRVLREVKDFINKLNPNRKTNTRLTNAEISNLIRLELYYSLLEDLKNYRNSKKFIIDDFIDYRISYYGMGREEIINVFSKALALEQQQEQKEKKRTIAELLKERIARGGA